MIAGAASDGPADTPPPSVTPTPTDGVIEAVGVEPSKLGGQRRSVDLHPDRRAGPIVLTVDRPADKRPWSWAPGRATASG